MNVLTLLDIDPGLGVWIAAVDGRAVGKWQQGDARVDSAGNPLVGDAEYGVAQSCC